MSTSTQAKSEEVNLDSNNVRRASLSDDAQQINDSPVVIDTASDGRPIVAHTTADDGPTLADNGPMVVDAVRPVVDEGPVVVNCPVEAVEDGPLVVEDGPVVVDTPVDDGPVVVDTP
eukprot:PhM_4_TR13676/c0_g3_i1/m.19369